VGRRVWADGRAPGRRARAPGRATVRFPKSVCRSVATARRREPRGLSPEGEFGAPEGRRNRPANRSKPAAALVARGRRGSARPMRPPVRPPPAAALGAAALVALACGSSSPPQAPAPDGNAGATSTPVEGAGSPGGSAGAGAAAGAPEGCTSSEQCGPGLRCQGDQGCDEPWTCKPAVPCTKDLRAYCGCDGKTFQASGSCPGRPFAKREGC
jgi:hypothetical protein